MAVLRFAVKNSGCLTAIEGVRVELTKSLFSSALTLALESFSNAVKD